MAYTIRVVIPQEMYTGLIFRTYEEAEKFLKERRYTCFGNGLWVEPMRWIKDQTMTVHIEELTYKAKE